MNRSKAQRTLRSRWLAMRNLDRPPAIVQQGSLHPYKRAKVVFDQAMKLRVELQHNLFALSEALAALPPYNSRGHGGKHRPKNRLIGGRWNQSRSKYAPHQGNAECGRRVYQACSPAVRAEARRIGRELFFDGAFVTGENIGVPA